MTVEERVLDAELVVRVVDERSIPLAGAMVFVRSGASGETMLATGSDGRVRLRNLSTDRSYLVRALPPASCADKHFASPVVETTVEAGEVTLEMRDAFLARGTVAYFDGTPVSGVWIHVSGRDGLVAKIMTRSEGRFELALPRGGPYSVKVTRDRGGSDALESVDHVVSAESPDLAIAVAE